MNRRSFLSFIPGAALAAALAARLLAAPVPKLLKLPEAADLPDGQYLLGCDCHSGNCVVTFTGVAKCD